MKMRSEGEPPHSSFFMPTFVVGLALCSEREQHREEGDPGEQNQDISRGREVSHVWLQRDVGGAS
jgi:hypothetical protein